MWAEEDAKRAKPAPLPASTSPFPLTTERAIAMVAFEAKTPAPYLVARLRRRDTPSRVAAEWAR